MVSALAAQLAKGASVNAEILASRSGGKPSAYSYLFSAREAAEHDLDSVLALAQNGLAQLSAMNSGLSKELPQSLFSDASRNLDRTLIPAEEVAQLNADIALVLRLISPYLLQAPAAKIIEWLVRRFRVNEFNHNDVLACFLPYHESPIFAKMLTIMTLKSTSMWSFLLPFKDSASPVPRSIISMEMTRRQDLARFIVSLLPNAVDAGAGQQVHRSLVAFSTGVIAEYITRTPTPKMDEGVIAFVLPACVTMVGASGFPVAKDVALAGALLLSHLSHRPQLTLTSSALETITVAVAQARKVIGDEHMVQTIVSILGPQKELVSLPGVVAREIIRCGDLEGILHRLLGCTGVERTLAPFVTRLLNRKFASSHKHAALRALVNLPASSASTASSAYLSVVVAPICAWAINTHISNKESIGTRVMRTKETIEVEKKEKEFLRALLEDIYQKQHEVFQSVAGAILTKQEGESTEEKEKRGEIVRGLVLDMSLNRVGSGTGPGAGATGTGSLSASDAFFAATSIDTTARIAGVKHIIQSLSLSPPSSSSPSSSSAPEQEQQQQQLDVLISLITNRSEDVSVLEAVYTTAPEALALALLSSSDGKRFLKDVVGVLATTVLSHLGISEEALKLHLEFFAKYILGGSKKNPESEVDERIVEQIFLPLLLFSKTTRGRALVAWQVLLDSPDVVSRSEVLKGTEAALAAALGGEEKLSKEAMVSLNDKLVAKLAENIVNSDKFDYHIKFFVGLTQRRAAEEEDIDAHPRLLGLLVVRELLGRLTGAHQTGLAYEALQAIVRSTSLEKVGEAIGDTVDDAQKLLDGAKSAVVSKPAVGATIVKLQAAILMQISGIVLPNVPIYWLEESISETEAASDMRGPSFVRLARLLYSELNIGYGALSPLSRHLLLSLFVTIGDATLLFLAGVWTSTEAASSSGSGIGLAHHASNAALHHARAFLTAHAPAAEGSAESKQRDFQVIVPALLVALQSQDRAVRDAASAVLSTMAGILRPVAGSTSTSPEVYAFDAAYRRSAVVQYLDTKDFDKYLASLVNHSTSFSIDPTYLTVFHRETLSKVKGEGKKETARKQGIICYLLSHAVAWNNLPCRISVLRSLQDVHDSAKLATIFPLIQELSNSAHSSLPVEYITLLLSAYDKASSTEIAKQGSPYWGTFMSVVRLWSSSHFDQARLKAVLQQAQWMTSFLTIPQRIELTTFLIEAASSSSDVWPLVKDSLPAMLADVQVAVSLLIQFKPAERAAEEERSPKRQKTEGPIESGSLQSIICLLEALSSSSISGSIELARTLLDVLQAVSYTHAPSRSDADYVEQLIISILETVVASIDSPVSPVALQVDVLVRLIGVSENPQTFNQALLLISNMARFASESIIHSVMPIFTFIDKNVIHRDDEYSFKVVQQAISNIVPVMVPHLMREHASGVDLYIDAREFITLFTDASYHVLTHRRTKFLTHFTKTLGADTFLAPVCMLLVDRVASEVVSKSSNERAATLSPALSLLKTQQAPIQLQVLLEVARECSRLAQYAVNQSPDTKTFLTIPTGRTSKSTSTGAVVHKRLLALVMFVLHGWSQLQAKTVIGLPAEPYDNMISETLQILLSLATTKAGDVASRIEGLKETAQGAITAGLTVIPVDRFMRLVQPIIGSLNDSIAIAAMELLADRIGTVSAAARSKISSSLTTIIGNLASVLQAASSTPLLVAALRTINALAPSASSAEDGALTKVVPHVLDFDRLRRVLVEVLPTLNSLVLKLGPRFIPHLRNTIKFCIDAMKTDAELAPDSLVVLTSALTTMPSFWGAELGTVVTVLLDVKLDATPPLRARIDTLMEAAATTLPASTILPVLIELWDSDPSPETLHDYFDLLERSLNHAPRSEVTERVRPIFVLFLEVFDLPSTAEGGDEKLINTIERQSINTFVAYVQKLSELTFTPLFRRLQDWAWRAENSTAGVLVRRKTTLCRIVGALLETFNALMAPYLSLMLPVVLEQFQSYAKGETSDPVLWVQIISMLDNTFSLDGDGALWNDKQLGSLAADLVRQVAVYPTLPAAGREDCLAPCLAHLALCLSREDQIKKLNLDILMQTRSEDARVRLLALRSSVEVWTVAGVVMSPFVTDTITFIHECAEDENDGVAKEARKLKRIIEGIAGPIGDH